MTYGIQKLFPKWYLVYEVETGNEIAAIKSLRTAEQLKQRLESVNA